MNDKSEGLLTQILGYVSDTQAMVSGYDARISKVEKDVLSINGKLDQIVVEAFPSGDTVAHRTWHETKQISAWRRFIIRMVS